MKAIHLSLKPIYLHLHQPAAHQPWLHSYRQRMWMGWRGIPIKILLLEWSFGRYTENSCHRNVLILSWKSMSFMNEIVFLVYIAPLVPWDTPGSCVFSCTVYVNGPDLSLLRLLLSFWKKKHKACSHSTAEYWHNKHVLLNIFLLNKCVFHVLCSKLAMTVVVVVRGNLQSSTFSPTKCKMEIYII